jgi:MSHA pilin protein MshC
MGILVASAAPHFFSLSAFSQWGYADELAAAVRYSQKIAVSSECPVRFTISATGYQSQQRISCNSGGWTIPVVYNDGSSVAGTKPAGLALLPSATQFIVNATGGISGGGNVVITLPSRVVAVDGQSGFVSIT